MSTFTRALSTNAWVNRPSIGLDTEVGEIGVLTEDTIRKARLAVCEHAVNMAEVRELLDELGIGVAAC